MNTTQKIIECLDENLKEYKQPVTQLSKTDMNNFITDDTLMFDWDNISKSFPGDESSSVDAIYCSYQNNELTFYFFEFKNQNLYGEFFDAKKQLETCINDLDQCVFCCGYPKQFRKIKKKLISKNLISLKTKPLESLITLHKILNDLGISHEDIVKIKKEYYVVSITPINENKSNSHRKGRYSEIFGFIDKITPFPFVNVEPINEKTFLSLINSLKKEN